MVLMSCPECRRAVSNNARFCPYCGGAVTSAARAEASAEASRATTQSTGELKIHLVISIALFWGGIVLAALATPSVTSSSEPSSTLGLFMPLITGMMISAGVFGYVVTKLRLRYWK